MALGTRAPRALAARSGRFEALVLCYHAVTAGWPHELAVTPQALERQLRTLLGLRFRPVDAASVVSGERRQMHVTFDDAFLSVARAVPILARLRVPATVFACSGYADYPRPLAIPELATEAERYPAELTTMGWDALRELAERGLEIGAHTISHPHLPQLGDAELEREVAEPKERIETELGRPCRFLAYPFGDEDDRVHAAARRAGYEAGFALPGASKPINRYALPRVGIWRKDVLPRALLKVAARRLR